MLYSVKWGNELFAQIVWIGIGQNKLEIESAYGKIGKRGKYRQVPDFDEEDAKWLVDRFWQAGAHLMGSVTYRGMSPYWPTSTEPYAAPMNRIPKIVFSKSLSQTTWGETRIVTGDLATEIARLKQEPGKPLVARGGASFAQALIETGLVDELYGMRELARQCPQQHGIQGPAPKS